MKFKISGAFFIALWRVFIFGNRKPENILTPEIIRETFQMTAALQKHPFFDCPLIIRRDDTRQ